jgi:transcriptional regulator with GAF, ATPase, and Fis domain
VAATNRNLAAEVEAGRFRQDLFYRLSVFPIENPPLRERREDIPRLAEHFIRTAAKRMNRKPPKFTNAAARQLSARDWPGNVRELQNAVERAVILSRGNPLVFDETSVPPKVQASALGQGASMLTRSELKERERESLVAALAQTRGKIFGPDGAAALLGMKPSPRASRCWAFSESNPESAKSVCPGWNTQLGDAAPEARREDFQWTSFQNAGCQVSKLFTKMN